MARSLYGKNIHKFLVNKASKRFSEKGYTVLKEAKMSGRARIDALALKGSEKIGIECQLTISYDIIRQKVRDYGKYLTKMIIIVPAYREVKAKAVLDRISKEEKTPKNFFEVWTENIDSPTTIRVSRKTKESLESVGNMGESYEDVIRRIAMYYLEHRRKRNGPSR